MDQRVGVPQVVEELIAQAEALVCAGDETGDVEEFYRDGAAAVDAGTIVWPTSVRDFEAAACAVDLEVAYRSLGVDRSEAVARRSKVRNMTRGLEEELSVRKVA